MKPFTITKLPSQTPTAGNSVIFNLPFNGKIQFGKVILQGNVVISGGTTSGTKKGEAQYQGGAIARLVKRVIVRCNPAPGSRYSGGEMCFASPRALLREGILQHRKWFSDITGIFAGVASYGGDLGAGAANTYGVNLQIPVFFADPNFIRSGLTALNADPKAYQSIQVEVQFGTLADAFAGNDRTLDLSGLKVRWVDWRHNYAGDTFELFQESHRTLISASRPDFTDAGLPTNRRLMQMSIFTEKDVYETLTQGIINKIDIEEGTDAAGYELHAEGLDVQEQMIRENWYDLAQDLTGQYLIDFCDGNINAAINPTDLSAVFDINMLTATPNVDAFHVYTRGYRVPDGFNATVMQEYAQKSV